MSPIRAVWFDFGESLINRTHKYAPGPTGSASRGTLSPLERATKRRVGRRTSNNASDPRIVLVAEPFENPLGRMTLLARRAQVLDQHHVDLLAHRIKHHRASRRVLARRRDGRVYRRAHRASMHPVLGRQHPNRHLIVLPVEPDRRVQLHPRPHPAPVRERTDEQRTRKRSANI
jgi:hypothetical protein